MNVWWKPAGLHEYFSSNRGGKRKIENHSLSLTVVDLQGAVLSNKNQKKTPLILVLFLVPSADKTQLLLLLLFFLSGRQPSRRR